MLLGGIRYLLPAIEAAHRHGCHVITVDYLPDNIAHKYSDEYHNVSILDKEAVLSLAKELQIDGILSFAVDPGVVTAAYVSEQMGLPFTCSYEAACILQDKSRFRQFLSSNGFNVPNAKGYTDSEEALQDVDYFNWPVIVKPVDSAGSKGVTRVDDPKNLKEAILHALDESHNGHFIIEDFLEKEGLSSGSESFFVEGELKYNGFYDQYFDNEASNPFTPSAECWPADKDPKYLGEIRNELQRLGSLLHVQTGLFNVEWRVCRNGKAYLMEVSPRAGGNRWPKCSTMQLTLILLRPKCARLSVNRFQWCMNPITMAIMQFWFFITNLLEFSIIWRLMRILGINMLLRKKFVCVKAIG